MTHTHYIATPISEPPKEKLTEVFCVLKSGARLTCDYIPQVNQWYDSESGQQIEPTHYLKPCTETGAVDMTNWKTLDEETPPVYTQIIVLCEDEDGQYPICGLTQGDPLTIYNLEDWKTENQSIIENPIAWTHLPQPK